MKMTRSEIVERSKKKLYNKYILLLRKQDDKDLIDYIEEHRKNDEPLRKIMTDLLRKAGEK